ncbi:MAG: CDP-diacylglycerol--serine O-phosphatidyltransferase [Vicinamibacterales bacterium]
MSTDAPPPADTRLRFLRRSQDRRPRVRRGVALLPSLFTMGNMFCGYSCIIYALHGNFESAAPYIGISIVLDMLDGRIARLTGTSSEFGLQLDSLADAISFGVAPAILAYVWGLEPLGRVGMFSGFLFVSAAVLRLARFNVQSAAGGDKRYFVGMPSPAAAGVPAATVYLFSGGLHDFRASLGALAMVLVPALLMVSTIRFRSFKTLDLQMRRPYTVLFLVAVGIWAVATQPRLVLVGMAYTYLASAFIGMAMTRFKHRGQPPTGDAARPDQPAADAANQ